MISEEKSFGFLYPELLKRWNASKNESNSPYHYSPKSRLRVHWTCIEGHDFLCSIASAVKGFKCPSCNSLAVKFPDVAKQWISEKNGSLTPYDVPPKSDKNVWWCCESGHEWKSQIKNRSNGNGCPYCAGQKASTTNNLAMLHPDIASQWHPKKNEGKAAEDYTSGSKENIWWQCIKNPKHEWLVRINARTAGNGCPFCSGQYACEDNNFAKLYPKIAAEWDYEKNGDVTPQSLRPGSDYTAVWKCLKEGHSWEQTIDKRVRGYNCPVCGNKVLHPDNCLSARRPELAKEWHPEKNGDKTPEQFIDGSSKKVWWQCEKKHEWKTTISSRCSGRGCPRCRPNVSRLELRVFSELSYCLSGAQSTAKVYGLEVDILLPKQSVGIESDGYHWHKDKVGFDKIKGEKLCQNGITLIRLRETPLPLISVHDVQYDKKDDQIDVVQRLFERLITLEELDNTAKKAIQDWLTDRIFKNDREYSELVSNIHVPPEGKSLADRFPKVSCEWDHDKNGGLLPENFFAMSDMKVHWKCHKGHSWEAQIKSRSTGAECPYCCHRLASSEYCLASMDPKLASQWDQLKNGDLTPYDVTPNSGKKVWWVCEKGHKWRAPVYSRSYGNNCGECSRKGRRDNYVK